MCKFLEEKDGKKTGAAGDGSCKGKAQLENG